MDWLESGIRSFSQEQKVKEIRSRFNSYKINKEASKDTPIKEAKPKETKVEKSKESKEVKPKESKPAGKILEPSKIIYELYQFVSKEPVYYKSFEQTFENLVIKQIASVTKSSKKSSSPSPTIVIPTDNVEEAIKILKKLGYKIMKPVTNYEEV